jgi:hypothetical protein
MSKRVIPLLLGMLIASAGWGGEQGQTTVATELRSEPYIDAKSSGTLPANARVEILKRQGGWLQVKSAGGDGWVKLPSIRLSTAAPVRAGDAGVRELLNVAQTGRSGSSGTTVATGVRGLSAEDLKNPTPDPEAVKKLDAFTIPKAEAESYAHQASLSRQTLEYLASGKSASSSNPGSGPASGGASVFGGPGR